MIRKGIIVMLTLGAVASVALLMDAHRTHRRSDLPAWGCSFGAYRVSIYRIVRRVLVPPRSTWGDTPGRVVIIFTNNEAKDIWTNMPFFTRWSLGSVKFLGTSSFWSLELSLWYVAGLLGVYPTIALVAGPVRRYRRRKRGQCVNCGYDLRGSAGRCPECGSAKALYWARR